MLEQIQDFAKNLSEEVMDVPRNVRDLVGGTIAMTIIDNSPLENIINNAASAVPVSDQQKQTVAAGMTYAVARVICRTGEKSLGF
jgi:hypothetical protein